MQALSYLFLAAAILSVSAQGPGQTQNLANQSCQFGVLPRREWREYTPAEKTSYINVLKKLQVRANGGMSFYDSMVQIHVDNAGPVHGYPAFLPWHRYYLVVLEREFQKSGKMSLAYWDWNKDSQAPEAGSIFGTDSNSYGRNGDASRGGCVSTGAFANYQTVYPSRGCLRRNTGSRMGAFLSTDGLRSLLSRSNTFDQCRTNLEGPHGSVHVSIGGNMSNMGSPNDPIFFMHHANVDRQWALWQSMKASLAKTYNGVTYERRQATPNDQLPAPYGIARVSDVFDTRRLCYEYRTTVVNEGIKEGGMFGFGDGGEVDDHRLAQLVRAVQARAPGSNVPNANDRGDLFDLRAPEPIPDEWIKLNNLDSSSIRRCEEEIKQDVLACNTQEDFASSALWSDGELLERLLLLFAEQGENFTIKVGKETVDVHIDPKQGPQWLFYFRQQIRNVLIMLASGHGRK